jgi:two-component system KDP operon response regulator KdpE
MSESPVISESPEARPSGKGGTILLAEDDLAVVAMLRDALEQRGHRVWHAQSGAEALFLAEKIDPEVIVLDLMLPDVNGLTICDDLHQRTDAPIIVCSATKRHEDAVLAFKLGASDFVAKPFYLPEMEARIEAARRRRAEARPPAEARRPGGAAAPQLIGDLVIDRASRRVALAGAPIHLTPTEYRLLEVLAANADRVLSRVELIQAIWGSDDPELGESLAVHARRLRSKLRREDALAPSIVAVRGFGYRLLESA